MTDALRTSGRVERRMPARDRGWLGLDHIRVFGPFRAVTADGLRTALVGMHGDQPDNPAVCLIEDARRVSLTAASFAALSGELAVALPAPAGPPRAAADAIARYLVDTPLGSRPLLFAVCGGSVGVKMSHTVGDGRVVNTVVPELIRAAAAGRAAQPPFPAPARLPIARAAVHHFGRHPARLPSVLRLGRPPSADRVPPDDTVAWRPDIAYASLSSAETLGRIRAWRNAHQPGVSAAAVLFAATAAAFERCGLAPKWPGAVVLVDARRYLPAGTVVHGNFSWGQYLAPADPADPAQVYRAMTDQLATGRALAMLALRSGRLLLGAGRPAAERGRISAQRRPELTFTHVGRLDAYADLPWAPGERFNISVPTTSGPEAITVSFSELAGVLYVNASFHRSTFDPGAVSAAVELVSRDPVALVDRPVRVG